MEDATTKTTKRICGRERMLDSGRRYHASRPMAGRSGQLVPIFVRDAAGRLVEVLEGFSYDKANDFLDAFHDGATSWDGRVW